MENSFFTVIKRKKIIFTIYGVQNLCVRFFLINWCINYARNNRHSTCQLLHVPKRPVLHNVAYLARLSHSLWLARNYMWK